MKLDNFKCIYITFHKPSNTLDEQIQVLHLKSTMVVLDLFVIHTFIQVLKHTAIEDT